MKIFGITLFEKQGIGLALSGGGIRGFYHIGVLNALRKHQVKIGKISGTSIGAIVGAIYASNPEVDFNDILDELNFIKISTLIASTYGKNKTLELENFLKQHIKATTFRELKIPFSFNATDINNKKEIVYESGELFPALIASASMPGVFPPVNLAGNYLVDGGVINNIPVSHLSKYSKIVISDIIGPIKTVDDKTSNLDVIYTSLAFSQQQNSLHILNEQGYKNKKIVYLELNDLQTFILDFRKQNYKNLVNLGYKAVEDNLSSIL